MCSTAPNQLRIFISLIASIVVLSGATPLTFAQQNDEKELFLVAQKAFEDGFYDVAIRYIDQLFENYPQTDKRIQANLLLGQCYFFKSQYLKAYDIFQELLQYSEFRDATLFWLGETYLKGSDYTKAKKQYQQLIDLYPDSLYAPQAHYSIGWCHFAQNEFKKAIEAFQFIVNNFPTHELAEDASFKLAETYYNLRSYENCIAKFQNYVLNFPQSRRHAQAYFYIAESYYFLKNYLTAVTYYAKTAELAYDNKLILISKVNLGWSYMKLEKFKLAQQYFDEAYQFAQEKRILSDDVLLGKATFYAETGDQEKALDSYLELIKNFPDSERIAEANLGLANTYYQSQKYKKAIETYRTIIEKTPEEPGRREILEKTYFGLAWAQLKSGDIDGAVQSFETIQNKTASKTVKISALTQIGDAYQDVGQFAKAIEVYDKILRDFSDSPYTDYVQYRQGIALLKLEKIEAATLSFQSLKRNFPTSKYLNDINYYLAVAHFKKQDWRTAKSYIQDFIRGLPKVNAFMAEAHYILALSHYNLHEYREAAKVFAVIINDFPEETAIANNAELYLAKCAYDQGSVDQALDSFKALVKKYPKSKVAQEALMWLGDHYLEASDFPQAIRHYNQYSDMFPGSPELEIVYFELGRAYQAMEQYDKAVAAFNHISREKDLSLYEKSRLAIADIFSKDLDSESAVQTYEKIIETSPEFKRNAYIKIAKIQTKARNYASAITAYKNAQAAPLTTKEHSNAELQFLIADAYQLFNQNERAIEEYLKVSYLYGKEVNWVIKAHLRMARIFEDNEQWEDARITYTKVLAYDTEEAKFAQERLDWIKDHVQP